MENKIIKYPAAHLTLRRRRLGQIIDIYGQRIDPTYSQRFVNYVQELLKENPKKENPKSSRTRIIKKGDYTLIELINNIVDSERYLYGKQWGGTYTGYLPDYGYNKTNLFLGINGGGMPSWWIERTNENSTCNTSNFEKVSGKDICTYLIKEEIDDLNELYPIGKVRVNLRKIKSKMDIFAKDYTRAKQKVIEYILN